MNTYYKQCCLSKPTPTGHIQTVIWIPEEFGVVGKVLKLKTDGVWNNGWIVKFASSNRLEQKLVLDSHDAIKAHRDRTGDSMPKRTNSA
jgi:hypothetical protein